MKVNRVKQITYEFTFTPDEAEYLAFIMSVFLGSDGDYVQEKVFAENIYDEIAGDSED